LPGWVFHAIACNAARKVEDSETADRMRDELRAPGVLIAGGLRGTTGRRTDRDAYAASNVGDEDARPI